MQFCIKMLHGWAGGSSVFFLHARSVVGPPEVRFAHPVRLRLTPIHKVMGDHASVGPTTDRAFMYFIGIISLK